MVFIYSATVLVNIWHCLQLQVNRENKTHGGDLVASVLKVEECRGKLGCNS